MSIRDRFGVNSGLGLAMAIVLACAGIVLAMGKPDKPPKGEDTTPPGAITDLSLDNVKSTRVRLSWTAPGDDGNSGTATLYDIRFCPCAKEDFDFVTAMPVSNPPSPLSAGSRQSFEITDLMPVTTYSFSITATDDQGNVSAQSNVVEATTTASPPPGAWSFEMIAPDAGYYQTHAYDRDGNPAIVYSGPNESVRLAQWDGSTWTSEFIDNFQGDGSLDLEFDPAGNPGNPNVIFTTLKVFFAERDGAGAWNSTVVDQGDAIIGSHSLAYDGAGNPAILYRTTKGNRFNHRLAQWNGTSWDIENITDQGNVRGALAFDSNGNPTITFSQSSSNNDPSTVFFACKENGNWNIEEAQTQPGFAKNAALAYGPDGRVSLVNVTSDGSRIDVVFLRRNADTCSGGGGWSAPQSIDPESAQIAQADLVYGADGTAYVSYYDYFPGQLKVARMCESGKNFGCEIPGAVVDQWVIEVVAEIGGDADPPAIKLDADGIPSLSFQDSDTRELWFARCNPDLSSICSGS